MRMREKGVGRLHDLITEHLRSWDQDDDVDSIADAIIEDMRTDLRWSLDEENE